MNKLHLLSVILLVALSSCHKEKLYVLPEHFEEGLDQGINYGLAADYLNDEGIEANPYVLAKEDFETGEVEIYTEEDRYKNNVEVVSEHAFTGKFGAKHSWPEGLNGPTCRYPIPEKAHEGDNPTYFVRMYFKFDKSFHPGEGMEPVGVKGFGIYNESGPSGVYVPCDGTNWYDISCQFVGWGPSVKEVANDKYLWFGHMYSYNGYVEQAISDVGEIKISDPAEGDRPYRFSIYSNPYKYLKFDEWNCYELGLYLNTPGVANGEARFWINGELQSRAVNMRFRDIESLKPETIHLNLHRTTGNFPDTMYRYADNIVIATRYIGPVKTNSN